MIKAINVYEAAKKTFRKYGDEQYALSKADEFLKQCGGDPQGEPEKDILESIVIRTVNAILSIEAKKTFWKNLGGNIKNEGKAVLELDLPDSCGECQLVSEHEDNKGIYYYYACIDRHSVDVVPSAKSRAKFCPLKLSSD